MAIWIRSAITSLAILVACSTSNTPGDPSGQSGGSPPDGPGDAPGDATPPPDAPDTGNTSAPEAPPRACPLGTATWDRQLGLATPTQAGSVAVDAHGDVLFAVAAASSGSPPGLTKLSPSGDILYTRPFGEVVATDRSGNAYVAGSFSAPIDLGLGTVEPHGASDVYVVKLDASGDTVFARALGLCSAGAVQSIAVDRTGRVAVSGPELGTAVLDARGELERTFELAGAVAFDSRGRLVIFGPLASGTDLGDGPVVLPPPATDAAFVIELDRQGRRIWSQVFPGSGVTPTAVAIDPRDAVVVVGYYTDFIVLFGERFDAIYAPEAGRVTGAFVVKLDKRGQLVWMHGDAGIVEANGVATDARGNVIVNGASTGNVGFFRIVTVLELDAAGQPIGGHTSFPASGYGRGFGVAVDACRSIYVAVVALDFIGALSPIHAHVVKLPPAPP